VEGYDEVLRRRVWIFRQEAGTEPLSDARRDIARPSRLRWIGGERSATKNWDAFEAPQGRPLTSVGLQSQPWSAVRHWMSDLAMELDAASKDGTLPAVITPSHVWLTGTGRALLLDAAWNNDADDQSFEVRTPEGAQKFLSAVAKQILDPRTVPLHAGNVLDKLAKSAFDRVSFAAGNLQSLLAKPASISQGRRALSLLLAPALMYGFALLIFSAGRTNDIAADTAWHKKYPSQPPLSAVLRLHDASNPKASGQFIRIPDPDLYQRDIPLYVAAHYRDSLAEYAARPETDDSDLPLNNFGREYLRKCFSKYPTGSAAVTPEAVADADAHISLAMPSFVQEESNSFMPWSLGALRNSLVLISVVQLFSIVLFRSTPGQRLFGFVLLNKKGVRIGRLRMLGRWLIAWAPIVLIAVRFEMHDFANQPLNTGDLVHFWLFGAAFACGVITSIAVANRGWHDRRSGTWIVPR
jgi:hypothetical protein